MEAIDDNLVRQKNNKFKSINVIGDCEFLLSIIIFFPYIIYIINNIARYFIPTTYKIDSILIYSLYGLLCLFSLKNILRRIKPWQILIIFSILFVVFLSTFSVISNSTQFEVLTIIFQSCFPVFLVAGTVEDFSKLKYYVNKLARITPYFLAFTIYILGSGILNNGEKYSQSMGYFLLLPTIVLLSALIERFSIKTLIPFLISFFTMFSFGARGPLVCVVIFAVLKFILELRVNSKKNRWILIAVICVFATLVYINLFTIFHWLLDLYGKLGFSTRSLQRILDNSFFDDKARKDIYQYCLDFIVNHPFSGTGVINDRIYISNALYNGNAAIGNYPHNIFIEIMMQFGILPGIILIGVLIIMLSKCLFQTKDSAPRDMIIIYVAIGLFPLFFSESYIECPEFYVLVGLCGAYLSYCKHNPFHKGTDRKKYD